jgi:hypothetical protein
MLIEDVNQLIEAGKHKRTCEQLSAGKYNPARQGKKKETPQNKFGVLFLYFSGS